MNYSVNSHQLNRLIEIIQKEYLVFGPKKKKNVSVLEKIEKISEINIFSNKTTIPFKKFLFSNNLIIDDQKAEKNAFIGLPLCDVKALHIFLDEFSNTDLLPSRNDILIISAECMPDKDCFCHLFSANRHEGYDIYIEKSGENFLLFCPTRKGLEIVKKIGLKSTMKNIIPKPIKEQYIDFNDKILKELVENRHEFEELWQKISNNCYGCGACTAVCPLCFCFRQKEANSLNQECKQKLKWDSCFAKEFSEIQQGLDLRPKNIDRLYNWYHHKFVRAKLDKGHYLCVGCGRCIKACPANLNIKNILSSMDKIIEEHINEK